MVTKAITKKAEAEQERSNPESVEPVIRTTGKVREDSVVMVLMPLATFEAFKELGLKLELTPAELMNVALRNLLTKIEKSGAQSIAREKKS